MDQNDCYKRRVKAITGLGSVAYPQELIGAENMVSQHTLAHRDVSSSSEWGAVISVLEQRFGHPIVDVLDFAAGRLESGGAWGVVLSRWAERIGHYGQIWQASSNVLWEVIDRFPLAEEDANYIEQHPTIQWSSVQLIYPNDSAIIELVYTDSRWQPVISFLSQDALTLCENRLATSHPASCIIPSQSPLVMLATRALRSEHLSMFPVLPMDMSRVSSSLPEVILTALQTCTASRRLAVDSISDQNDLIEEIVSKFPLSLCSKFLPQDYPETSHETY